MHRGVILTINLVLFSAISSHSQDAELVKKNTRPNLIKTDITSHILYRRAYTLTYERTVSPSRSFVVTLGYQELPKFESFGSRISAKSEVGRSGYKIGGEFRFYLPVENKFNAPRGVFLGPYFSHLGFKNSRNISVDVLQSKESVVLKSRISVTNFGFQVGYQFIVFSRLVIDLVFFGPSISLYTARFDLEGNFSFDESEIKNDIVREMIDRFPSIKELLRDSTYKTSGSLSSWSAGYRYQFHIGYAFGKKR